MSFIKREIRHFHIVVMHWWQRNVQKSVVHMQSCCSANLRLLLFCRSRWCRCRRCLSSPKTMNFTPASEMYETVLINKLQSYFVYSKKLACCNFLNFFLPEGSYILSNEMSDKNQQYYFPWSQGCLIFFLAVDVHCSCRNIYDAYLSAARTTGGV